MSEHAEKGLIIFDHVSKRYRLGALGTMRGSVSAVMSRLRGTDDTARVLWALNDVSFRLEPGHSLGLIGPNGAGKSTTLKLLSDITRPSSGQIAVHGRVSSLIELGAGFHPELTGRENVYLNGAILGLSRREIASKMDAIVAFSEIARFIDTPVKRYSSGMYVRLGFAVAAHVEPDILLVDEVLAVGDASFRQRCILRMRELQHKGTTVIFVSHNMHLVRNMCESVLLLVNGRVRLAGAPSTVIAEYERVLLSGPTEEGTAQVAQTRPGFDTPGAIVLSSAEMVSTNSDSASDLNSHLPAKLQIYYKTGSPQPIGRLDVKIMRDDGTLCSTADSSRFAGADHPLHELYGDGMIEVAYDPLQLTTGRYVALVQITDPSDSLVVASVQTDPFFVHAEGGGPDRGVFVPLVSWSKQSSKAVVSVNPAEIDPSSDILSGGLVGMSSPGTNGSSTFNG